MATFALLGWLVMAPIVFARCAVVSAIIWAVLLPYMFLPEAFEIPLPGLPDLDKVAVISLGLVIGFFCFRSKFAQATKESALILKNSIFRTLVLACFALSMFGILVTVFNNQEPLRFGITFLPGLRLWDGISFLGEFTLFIIPFFFAQRYLATPEAHRALLTAIALMGMFYTLLMLLEIRFSPQLNVWVYGYHQHSWVQHIRDGFRPKVFLYHGLWVGFYMFMATMAAAALWKSTKDPKWLWAGIWMFLILMISKNLGAFGTAILFLAVFFGLWSSAQLRIASVVALCVLFYPALRQSQVIPTEQITGFFENISEERASSLQFRLNNEDKLLERAYLKFLTGWGGYGRDRIYSEKGKDLSISEGRWIQTLGLRGWLGYIGLFGILTLPVIFLTRVQRRKPVPAETCVLALIVAGNLIYMIPNSTLTPIGWLVFGALAGFVRYDQTAKAEVHEEGADTQARRSPYSRFPQRPTAPRQPGTASRGVVRS